MDKEDLIAQIKAIPKFVLRNVAIDSNVVQTEYTQNWVFDKRFKAITEENDTKPLCFASSRYKLIQFESVFMPLIANMDKVNGRILYYEGMGIMDIFPLEESLKENEASFGMVAFNSVNKTSSVIINFIVKHNDRIIRVPNKIVGFKKIHSGKAMQMTTNFLVVVDKVKNIWKTIINNFSTIKVSEDIAKNVLDSVGIKDEYIRKRLYVRIAQNPNMHLWDMFIEILKIVEEKKYKSDFHKRKKLDVVSECIFKYATISKLLGS